MVGILVTRYIEVLVAIIVFIVVDSEILEVFCFAEILVHVLVNSVTAAGRGAVSYFDDGVPVGAACVVERRVCLLDVYSICLVANFKGLVCICTCDNLNAIFLNACSDLASLISVVHNVDNVI